MSVLQDAAKVGEQGRKSLEVAQRMQVEISQQANELETRVLLLQEKERQIADVSWCNPCINDAIAGLAQ